MSKYKLFLSCKELPWASDTAQWLSTCLVSTTSWDGFPVPKKKKKMKESLPHTASKSLYVH